MVANVSISSPRAAVERRVPVGRRRRGMAPARGHRRGQDAVLGLGQRRVAVLEEARGTPSRSTSAPRGRRGRTRPSSPSPSQTTVATRDSAPAGANEWSAAAESGPSPPPRCATRARGYRRERRDEVARRAAAPKSSIAPTAASWRTRRRCSSACRSGRRARCRRSGGRRRGRRDSVMPTREVADRVQGPVAETVTMRTSALPYWFVPSDARHGAATVRRVAVRREQQRHVQVLVGRRP